MIKLALVCSASITSFLAAWLLGSLLWKGRAAEIRRLERFLKTDENPFKEKAVESEKKRRGLLAKLISTSNAGRLESLSDELYLADVALKAEEFLAVWLVCGVVFPLVMGILGIRTMVVMALVIVGSCVPISYVKLNKSKNMKQFEKQIPDALTIMCNSLRAGFSFQTAVDNIASELPNPISREFRRVSREAHLGMPLEESLNRLVERTGNEDLELIVSAVAIQRQVGGNLAEVLDNISGAIRQRIKLRGEIKTLTASGTISGYIIGLLPVLLMVVMMIISPSHVEMFFNTRIGNILLIVAVVMETTGFIFVRKIINVKF